MPTPVLNVFSVLLLCCIAGSVYAEQVAQYRWQQQSTAGLFQVVAEPSVAELPLNRFHSWFIRITDAEQQPVNPARIAISGGMPAHKHGLPSAPQVTEYLGDGRYLLEGMKFNMTGRWLITLAITAADGSHDTATFTIDIGY